MPYTASPSFAINVTLDDLWHANQHNECKIRKYKMIFILPYVASLDDPPAITKVNVNFPSIFGSLYFYLRFRRLCDII